MRTAWIVLPYKHADYAIHCLIEIVGSPRPGESMIVRSGWTKLSCAVTSFVVLAAPDLASATSTPAPTKRLVRVDLPHPIYPIIKIFFLGDAWTIT